MSPEELVARVFGQNVASIDDETSPDTLPEWDSLGHVTLIIELEAAYGVSFSPDQALEMRSVGAIKRALRERGAQW